MTDTVSCKDVAYTTKVRAIVKFGHAHPSMGQKAGEFYQVTVDPNMASPGGEFIRFGCYQGDEINGWQRIESMTVCEVLGESDAECVLTPAPEADPEACVSLRTIANG